ncbi:MAG TPA: c-type cytochrome [Anaerolineales bacterium]
MRQILRCRLWFYLLLLGSALLLASCAPSSLLPQAPTPIPTLIPATLSVGLEQPTEPPAFAILSYPARPPVVAEGHSLYLDQCASCHGEAGVGIVPGARNFNDVDYMRGETPASFYAAVTEGRQDMPAFSNELTSDERWDAVFYVWRFSTDGESLTSGEQIYHEDCAVCHGEGGTGEVLGAADFTDLRFVAENSPRDFYLTVTQGEGSMPAWQGRLSQEERWDVVDYLFTFSYDAELSEGQSQAVSSQPVPQPQEGNCDQYLSQSNPFPWDDAAAISSGEVIYDQSCGMCHGEDGSGGLPGAPDFTSPATGIEIRNNSGEQFCIIAEGRGSMPGWKETLTDEQMWQALTYINSFSE